MGKQIAVQSFSSPLNDVSDTTSAKNIVSSVCYQHKKELNHSILQSIMNGLSPKLKRVYKYGRDEYTYGLPNGTVTAFAELNYDIIKPIIEAEVGYEIAIQEGYLSEAQVKYFSMAHARVNWGYTFPDEELTNPPHPNALILRPDGAVLLGDNEVRHNFAITMSPEIETNPTVGNPNSSSVFYHIMFTPASNTAAPLEYWFYEQGSDIYPELENQEVNYGSPFLPIVPLRENNQNLGAELSRTENEDGTITVDYVRDEDGHKVVPDTELYRTSKKLLKKADITMDELCKTIETNPSLGDIDHAYVMFGINLQTKTLAGACYIHKYFKNSYEVNGSGNGGIRMEDARLSIALTYSSISLTEKTGELTKKYTLTLSGGNIITQRRLTSNTYEEIIVNGATHYNFIYAGTDWDWTDLIPSFFGSSETEYVKTTVSDVIGDEDNLNFIIPLNYGLIYEDISLFMREDLAYESMQIIYNCIEIKETSWWDSIWQIVLVVVCVVLAIVSAGTLAAAFIAAAAQGIVAVVILAIKVILINIGVRYIGKALAELLPPEWVMILSIVIAAFTMGAGLMNINLSANMMQAVSGFQMVLSRASEANYENLAKDADDWSKEAEELTEELEDLWDGMDTDVVIDYYEILERQMLEFEDESVEDYYNRTIHTGNIGTGLYNIIPNYVEESLKLPEIEKHGYT